MTTILKKKSILASTSFTTLNSKLDEKYGNQVFLIQFKIENKFVFFFNIRF